MEDSNTTMMIQKILDYMNQTGVDQDFLYNLSLSDSGAGGGGVSTRAPVVKNLYCGDGLEGFRQSYGKVHGYVSLVVCLFGMLANTMNIIVLTRKDMISPTNAILTGLALADNLVMIEYIPFAVHMYVLRERPLYEKFSYPWTVYVLIHAHVTQVFHTISIWLTLTLAVWRYLSVAHPLTSRSWCTLDRALLAIVIAYVGSPVLCIPLYLTFTIQERAMVNPHDTNQTLTLYFLGTSELAKANSSLLENINFWTYSVVVKILPCVALTILSFRLISALVQARERRDQLKNHRPGKTANAPGTSGPEGERHTDRTTKMLLAVLILFLITEFPQGILALLSGILGDAFFTNCYGHLGEVMDILALINGAINFILYCAMSRQFRQTFSRFFRPKMLDKWTTLTLHAQTANNETLKHRTTLVKDTHLSLEPPPAGV